MPTRSRGSVPDGAIQSLGLPGRAVTALTRAGVTRVEQLRILTRHELARIHGIGPGMIAAIRLVVPEPPEHAPRSGVSSAAEPTDGAAEEESPDAPAIPLFDSLRPPRRRTAIDLLMPEPPPAGPPRRAGSPRPAEYADLWRLGGRLLCAVTRAPWRVLRWSLGTPARRLRRCAER